MLGARHAFNSATFTRYLELANMAIAGGGAPAPVAVTNEAPIDSPPEQADPTQQPSPPEHVPQWNAAWGEQSSTYRRWQDDDASTSWREWSSGWSAANNWGGQQLGI